MHVINIGSPLGNSTNYEVSNLSFFGKENFLDGEMILWNIDLTYKSINTNPKGNNNVRISKNHAESLPEIIKKRKKEFSEFFQHGRVLILTGADSYDLKYSAVATDGTPAGNGKINLWDAIPISPPKCKEDSGKNIEQIDFIEAGDFVGSNKHSLYYQRIIEKSEGIPLFIIKGTKHVVGEYHYADRGLIIIIPEINYGKGTKTQELFSTLDTLSKKLKEIRKTNENIAFPDLVEKYTLNIEHESKAKLAELIKSKAKLEEDIREQEQILFEYKRLKLLYSSGDNLLEKICEEVFTKFGFNVKVPDNNRDDLIITSGNNVAVVEIKGVSKSAGERHASQLQKWVSDYHSKHEKEPKGVLIVNTFKNLPLHERTEKDFPDQMIPYVQRQMHCLITGFQLLAMFLDFMDKKISHEKVVKMLFETSGELRYTSKFEEYITETV